MQLQFHNQRTKQVDTFTPLQDGSVALYTCGPTVYNALHIGNWAAYIYWDILVRTLKHHGYAVARVMNITDVGHLVSDGDEGEDKLEAGARREGITAWDVAARYTEDFMQGMQRLNIVRPEHVIKATDFISEQLELVRVLQQKGHTYQIDDGIYFDTGTFPTYADFAGLDIAAQQAGARVTHNAQKRNPSDFALWKFTPDGTTRDMQWDTPADLVDDGVSRPGFPGWHLECSAMAMAKLGPSIDIHTGGIDHIPIHHTNEIAQSEAATGQRFSNFWLHNNHVKSDGTKISKSLGNGYTLDDIIQKGYDPMALRLFVLQSHYRTEGNFTFELLDAAQTRLKRWKAVAALRHQIDALHSADSFKAGRDAIAAALADDLNTPLALAAVDAAFDSFESMHEQDAASLGAFIAELDELFGLDLIGTTPNIAAGIAQRIQDRQAARDAHDWATSDAIRDELHQKGVVIRDTSYGPRWEYA